MKSVSLILSLSMLVAMATILASCKKDKEESPKSRVAGFWVGECTDGNFSTFFYAVLFRNDGTLREYRADPIAGGTDTATSRKYLGTYSISEHAINYTLKELGGTNSYAGTILNPPYETRIEGTWGIQTNTTNGGTFFINKQ